MVQHFLRLESSDIEKDAGADEHSCRALPGLNTNQFFQRAEFACDPVPFVNIKSRMGTSYVETSQRCS